jgi:hypothetical protein
MWMATRRKEPGSQPYAYSVSRISHTAIPFCERPRVHLWTVSLAIGAALLLAACGSPSENVSQPTTTSRPLTTTTATMTTLPPTTTTTDIAPGWAVVSSDVDGVAVEERRVTVPSGEAVTLVRFRAGRVVFDLHVGTSDPPANLRTVAQDRGPSVAADEASYLLAAFNGGFKMNAGEGGFDVQGQVLYPLVNGMASFVIDSDGSAHIGVWGSQLPAPGESVESVRQNQPPLITNGVTNPAVGNPGAWGATVNSSRVVARSAVGEDALGNIIYAGGMSLLPQDLSDALMNVSAVSAMQLDINPEWVQLDAAGAMGAPLTTRIPGQNRPADQYVVGWTRDFFAVMAKTTVTPGRHQ